MSPTATGTTFPPLIFLVLIETKYLARLRVWLQSLMPGFYSGLEKGEDDVGMMIVMMIMKIKMMMKIMPIIMIVTIMMIVTKMMIVTIMMM